MEEPLNIYQSRFSEYLKSIESESRILKDNLRIVASGKGRTAHLNNITESANKMQQIASVLKKMSLKEELIREKINIKLSRIIDNAIFLARKEEKEKEADDVNDDMNNNYTSDANEQVL